MIDKSLLQERALLIYNFYSELLKLSQMDQSEFFAEPRNVAATESYLRRSLEAIFDIGRHILAKTGHISLSLEYKAIAQGLRDNNIISPKLSNKLMDMAGYRNRLVRLYHQVTEKELYQIIQSDLDDLRDFVLEINNYLEGVDKKR